LAIYPAIDVRSGPADLIPAIVDDFRPTAIEERADSIRVFFIDTNLRNAAGAALSAARYIVQSIDVDDEDWAKRSQENLKPVTIERITVAPPWYPQPLAPSPRSLFVVIQPSMGFGTGHHATTRLCLRALQAMDLAGRFLLDVGTGSGILAIAAGKLGAVRAEGVDYDADAIAAANENLQLDSGVESVEFRVADLSAADLPAADVVTANLTGAALIGAAARLLDLVRPDGTLIVSGLLEEERDDVVRAFGALNHEAGPNKVRPTAVGRTFAGPDNVRPTAVGRTLSGPPLVIVWEQHEDGWVALAMKRS
jgi:ribosomal protein L11 methyltransferase